MILSKIISTAIVKGLLKVKVLGLGSSDVKTVFNLLPFGIDSNPSKDYRAIYADTGINGEKVLLGVLNKQILAEAGEIRIFSEIEGEIATFIHLKKNGKIELGGDSNFIAKFNELKTGFDQLKGDLNSHIQNYNSHVHPGVTAGGASTAVTVSTSTESEADIDEAKNDNLLI